MALFFGQRPGTVVRLDDSAVQCKIVLLAGLDPKIGFVGERSIVTRVVLSQNVNAQFLHTLGHYVYIYVFGDRVGELQLSGFAFPCDCDGPVHGGERLHHWYRQHKASRRRHPARFILGDTLLEGFIMGMRLDVVDTAINLMQWQANVVLLPEDDLVDPDAEDEKDSDNFEPDELPDYVVGPKKGKFWPTNDIVIGDPFDEINLDDPLGLGAGGNPLTVGGDPLGFGAGGDPTQQTQTSGPGAGGGPTQRTQNPPTGGQRTQDSPPLVVHYPSIPPAPI